MVDTLNFMWIFHILIINSVYLHIHKYEINNIKLALDVFGSFFIFSELFDKNSLSSWHQGYFAYNLIIDHILWGKWCCSQFNQEKIWKYSASQKNAGFFFATPHHWGINLMSRLKDAWKQNIFTHNIKINCVARASQKIAVRIMLQSSAKLPFERKETWKMWKTWHIHYTHTFVTIFSHISSHYLAVRFNEIKNISSIGSIVSCFELSASISFHNIYVCFQQPFCAIHWQLIITHRAN